MLYAKDMADNVREDEGVEIETTKVLFSEPWKGSDLILVVEDQKLHVHRLILSMASPVFEAMISRDFKEKDAAEIELPGKKADQMRDLLKEVYPEQVGNITMHNIENILKLADEYQMRGVLLLCENTLFMEPKPTKNLALKVLLLAQRYHMDKVRKHCYKLLSGMTLDELEQLDGFENLDRDSLWEVLGNILRDLEKLLKDIVPQFVGVVECARHLWIETGRPLKECPVHYMYHQPIKSFQTRLQCPICKEMLTSMTIPYAASGGQKSYPSLPRDIVFDKNLVVVLQDMFTLLKIQPSDS